MRSGENKFLDSNRGFKETTQSTFIGATYRFFPFGDPMSYFGQSNWSLGIEALNSEYTLKDDFISVSSKNQALLPRELELLFTNSIWSLGVSSSELFDQ